MFNYGILVIILVFVGVTVTLVSPLYLDRVCRWLFSRRFERLVAQNQVIPILTWDFDSEKHPSMLQERVTTESFMDVCIHGQASSSVREWKPLGASFIYRQDERPITGAILTSKAQKAEAKQQLDRFYHRRDPFRKSNMHHNITQRRERRTLAHEDVAATAGKLRYSTLILMPSKLHPQFQPPEIGPSSTEKAAGRWTTTQSLPTGTHSRTLSEFSGEEAGRPRYLFGDTRGMQTRLTIEIGVSEYILDQASEVLELMEDDRGRRVFFGGESDFDGVTHTLATRTRPSRYPIMYRRLSA